MVKQLNWGNYKVNKIHPGGLTLDVLKQRPCSGAFGLLREAQVMKNLGSRARNLVEHSYAAFTCS